MVRNALLLGGLFVCVTALPAAAQRSTSAGVSVPVGVIARAEVGAPASRASQSGEDVVAIAITVRANTAWRLVSIAPAGVRVAVIAADEGVEAIAVEAGGVLRSRSIATGPAGGAISVVVESRGDAGAAARDVRFEVLPD